MRLFLSISKIVMTERIFLGPSLSCLLCNIRDLARMKTEELQQRTKKNQRQINARRQNKRTFGTVQSLVCRKEIGNKWAEPLLLATRSLRL